jgi:tRNA threonylcarbamoyladenosine biosynthesis protein TsaE
MSEKIIHIKTEEDTKQLASDLARVIATLFKQNEDLRLHISLIGDLGAGKTTFTRYLLKALGHLGKVKSPTYALCEPYELTVNEKILSIHHFDLYRMKYAEEWIDAGFRETFSNPGICLVEWPEKAETSLPQIDASISLSMQDDESRIVKVHAYSILGNQLIDSLQ